MSEIQADGTPPTLEVRILRDGVVVERVPCVTDADADVVVQAWSDVEGVVVEVGDLTRGTERPGVLEPQPWEVDAEDLTYEATDLTEEEEEER